MTDAMLGEIPLHDMRGSNARAYHLEQRTRGGQGQDTGHPKPPSSRYHTRFEELSWACRLLSEIHSRLCKSLQTTHHLDGYYVAYKPITLSSILFMFVEMKFIHCHSCVMFAMKSMSMCND